MYGLRESYIAEVNQPHLISVVVQFGLRDGPVKGEILRYA
jgi:hypothetical protein